MDPASELRQADALHLEQRFDAAVEAYGRALAGDSALAEAWYGLGCACLRLKRHAESVAALRRAAALQPDAPGVLCNLGEVLFQSGDLDAAIAAYQRAATCGDAEAEAVALAGIACIAPGAPGTDNAAVLAARRRWAAFEARRVQPIVRTGAQPGGRPGPPGKLRVAYLSAFYGERNWMKMYMGVLNAHDRSRFEVHFLADRDPPSAGCGYDDHPEDRIWEIGGVSNAALAQHIADAGIDVLVDLNGYSFQRRLPLFLYRAAPRQICWNGMYGTTGLDTLDWLVGDASAIPPEEERFYTERIARVPGTYLPFRVFYPVPDVAPPPSLKAGHVTFGCFSSAYKLTEPTIAAYAAILRGAPESRLLVRNRPMGNAANRAALLARFAQLGVATERVALAPGDEHFAFLQDYAAVDIALDTFPYNGGTTTAEALWQGVPMLTCNGDRWAARTSRSLLLAAGLPAWVAADQAEFVDTAIRLARDPGTPNRLACLRQGMRAQLAASAACDTEALCRTLEALYVG